MDFKMKLNWPFESSSVCFDSPSPSFTLQLHISFVKVRKVIETIVPIMPRAFWLCHPRDVYQTENFKTISSTAIILALGVQNTKQKTLNSIFWNFGQILLKAVTSLHEKYICFMWEGIKLFKKYNVRVHCRESFERWFLAFQFQF